MKERKEKTREIDSAAIVADNMYKDYEYEKKIRDSYTKIQIPSTLRPVAIVKRKEENVPDNKEQVKRLAAKWTKDDIKELKNMVNNRRTFDDILARFDHRSAGGVIQKIRKECGTRSRVCTLVGGFLEAEKKYNRSKYATSNASSIKVKSSKDAGDKKVSKRIKTSPKFWTEGEIQVVHDMIAKNNSSNTCVKETIYDLAAALPNRKIAAIAYKVTKLSGSVKKAGENIPGANKIIYESVKNGKENKIKESKIKESKIKESKIKESKVKENKIKAGKKCTMPAVKRINETEYQKEYTLTMTIGQNNYHKKLDSEDECKGYYKAIKELNPNSNVIGSIIVNEVRLINETLLT